MLDYLNELLKLLLPGIIIEYFELSSYKKEYKCINLKTWGENVKIK